VFCGSIAGFVVLDAKSGETLTIGRVDEVPHSVCIHIYMCVCIHVYMCVYTCMYMYI